MPIVNIFEAKSTLSKLVADLESRRSTEVVIARNGKPVVKLVPLSAGSARVGLAAEACRIPDDIDLDNSRVADLFVGRTE